MIHVKTKAIGFEEGRAKIRAAIAALESEIIPEALEHWGDGLCELFRKRALANGFGEDTAIVDTQTYIDSWKAQVDGTKLGVGPTGDNKNMSNEALGELLEYGTAKMPARPHQRWLDEMGKNRINQLGKEIGDALSRRIGGG